MPVRPIAPGGRFGTMMLVAVAVSVVFGAGVGRGALTLATDAGPRVAPVVATFAGATFAGATFAGATFAGATFDGADEMPAEGGQVRAPRRAAASASSTRPSVPVLGVLAATAAGLAWITLGRAIYGRDRRGPAPFVRGAPPRAPPA